MKNSTITDIVWGKKIKTALSEFHVSGGLFQLNLY